MVKLDHKLYNVPGILLSVGEKNKISHHTSGLGDIEASKEILPSGLFRSGLISRLFTMGILLRLVDERAFDLDSPLQWVASKHQQDRGLLDILVSQYPILKPITVRDLLNNPSGLPSFDKTLTYNKIFTAKPRKIWQLENYLDSITGVDVQYQHGYEPRSRGYFSDSATNYILAGLVIDAVSGVKTSEAMRDLFREFGLDDTYYLSYGVMDQALLEQMTHGYLPVSHPFSMAFSEAPRVVYNDNKELSVIDVTNMYTVNGMSNASVVSTTADLITWFRQLISAKVVVNNYKQMFEVVPVKSFMGECEDFYCLGFYKSISKRYGEIVWSAGNSLGYGALIAHSVDRDLTFALLTNVSRQYFSLHSEGLVADVLDQLLG